ncbi:MAG: helix-turn-helix transcriptional regulator [Maricaulaceae bacterium]|nr:helix-turn-helix transcriptional regulator [Maricaulaceae bacterium]
MTKAKDLHRRWMKDPVYAEAYQALEQEFAIARALIEARSRAGLSQEEVARRMRTTQSAVARMESGEHLPSTRSLLRFAAATGSRLNVELKPA